MIVLRRFGLVYANGSRLFGKRRKRSRGKHNIGCTSDTQSKQQEAKIREKSSLRWAANCWALSGQ